MKKMKMLMILIMSVFFLPFMVSAEGANVSIEKISLDEEATTNENLVITEPVVNGLSIDFGLSFSEVGDKVVYKVDFVNKDSEDYELKFPAAGDGYVTYQYEFSDHSNVLKANSSKSLMITIEYKKEVPDNLLRDGKYTENNQINLALLNNEAKTVNPKTGQSLLFVVLIAVILIGSAIVVFKNHKSSKTLALLLAVGLMILPLSIYALKQLNVTINSHVEIVKVKEFCVLNYSAVGDVSGSIAPKSLTDGSLALKMVGNVGNMNTLSYTYKTNETFLDYITRNSKFVSSTGDALNPEYDFVTNSEEDSCNHNIVIFYTNEELETMYSGNGESTGTFQNGDAIILDESQGCYFISKNACGQH